MTDLELAGQKEYAQLLAASDILPDAFKNKPANVLWAIDYGRSLGLGITQTLMGINVIKGKPTASADLMKTLVRRAGHRLRLTSDNTKAVCEIIRSDDPTYTFMSVWDMDRAKQAGLTGNPSWQKFPEAMLKARAVSECVRDACSEVLAGNIYTPEDLEDTPAPRQTVAQPTPHEIRGIDPWARPTEPTSDVEEGEIIENEH